LKIKDRSSLDFISLGMSAKMAANGKHLQPVLLTYSELIKANDDLSSVFNYDIEALKARCSVVINKCFLLNPEKNLMQIRSVVFEKNVKTA